MEVEIRQLDLRYEGLRIRSPERDRRLLASLSELGQLSPIVVVFSGEGALPVLIDGYRRVRALSRLGRDVAKALSWDLTELEAVLFRRSLASSGGETSLEQAWLLEDLRVRFDLDLEELARWFDRSVSWVSRRLALLRELSSEVQDLIREGRIVPHAAAKHLVPLARANRDHCERLARAIAPHRLSSREVGEIYAAWRDGALAARERIVDDPALFLRTRRALGEEGKVSPGRRTGLLEDLLAISAIARRARRRVREGALTVLAPPEKDELRSALEAAGAGMGRLTDEIAKGMGGDDARRGTTDGDLRAREEGNVDPGDRPLARDLERGGEEGARVGEDGGSPVGAGGEGKALSRGDP